MKYCVIGYYINEIQYFGIIVLIGRLSVWN